MPKVRQICLNTRQTNKRVLNTSLVNVRLSCNHKKSLQHIHQVFQLELQ